MIQEGVLTEPQPVDPENNLLGYRKQVAIVPRWTRRANIGLQYVDKNIAGSHLQLLSRVDGVFTRDGGEYEGTRSYTSFDIPVVARSTAPGGMTHFNAVRRLKSDPRPTTTRHPRGGALPYEPTSDFDIETSGVRQLGHAVKTDSRSATTTVRRPNVLDDFPATASRRPPRARRPAPPERASRDRSPATASSIRYRVYRNIDSFDLAEDVQSGPTPAQWAPPARRSARGALPEARGAAA